MKNLRCYPLEYHAKQEQIEEDLLDRGMKFREYCIKPKGHQMFDYDGDVSFISKKPEDLFGEEYAQHVIMASVISEITERRSRREPEDNVCVGRMKKSYANTR